MIDYILKITGTGILPFNNTGYPLQKRYPVCKKLPVSYHLAAQYN